MQRRLTYITAPIACVLAALLAFSGLGAFAPALAFAATDNIYDEPSAEQMTVEESAAVYDEAVARVEALEQQIAENTARISTLETELPAQQEKSSESLRTLYLLQEEGFSLLNLLLGSQTLTDFLTKFEYIERVQQENYREVARMTAMQQELEDKRASLDTDRTAAEEERERASAALAEAQAARERAQQEAQARAAAEAAAAAAAAAEQAAAQEEAAAGTNGGAAEGSGTSSGEGSSGGGTAVTPPASDNADWSSDKASFVSSWAGRINAYLSGSPLSGQGSTFAAAAWDYGVDPRWSPAISCIESTKGAYCFLPHNAWGWGSISWGSWEEAINAHVRGLARGYGYTISVSAAQKYCPPNWEFWYNRVSEEMNKI